MNFKTSRALCALLLNIKLKDAQWNNLKKLSTAKKLKVAYNIVEATKIDLPPNITWRVLGRFSNILWKFLKTILGSS